MQQNRRRRAWSSWIRLGIYVLGLLPAVWYFYLGISDRLGADPVKTLERMLGLWSLRFLVLGLAITPLHRLGGPNLVGYRRAVGLLAFVYALLHVLVYVALDQQFDWPAILRDIVKRPYITIGLTAFLILVPLALTSNDRLVRRLGALAWRRLHWWVYPAALAGALHYLLLVKSWPFDPIMYTFLVVALLGFRILWRGRRRPHRSPGAIVDRSA